MELDAKGKNKEIIIDEDQYIDEKSAKLIENIMQNWRQR